MNYITNWANSIDSFKQTDLSDREFRFKSKNNKYWSPKKTDHTRHTFIEATKKKTINSYPKLKSVHITT